jgi:hypothetical protein
VLASCRTSARNSLSGKSVTPFSGNEENDIPVESWRIDDLVIAKISESLGNHAAVRRIAYQREAFASPEAAKLFRNDEAEVGEVHRRAVAVRPALSSSREHIGPLPLPTRLSAGSGSYAGVGPLSMANLYALFSLRL